MVGMAEEVMEEEETWEPSKEVKPIKFMLDVVHADETDFKIIQNQKLIHRVFVFSSTSYSQTTQY